MSADRAASVMARLLNRARDTGENYNLLLSRFAIERLLYRLSVSPHANSFVLKGALLFALWYDTPHRPTKDADLLGFGAHDEDTLRAVFTKVSAIDADDGVRFDASSIRIAPIRDDKAYGGLRLTVLGFVGNARLPVQVDIGFGDAVTPAAELVSYPVLLDGMAAPRLRAYPVYTVVAEKFDAMVQLGVNNSRMKDFFDLMVIAESSALDGSIFVDAVRATFDRRGTALPRSTPIALTAEFATDAVKLQQWRAFIAKSGLPARELHEVIAILDAFLLPPVNAALADRPFAGIWDPALLRWS